VSADAMQKSVTHHLLKQTTVQFQENSALQTLLHSVALASFTADKKFSPRTPLLAGPKGPKPTMPAVSHSLCLIAAMKRLQTTSLLAA